jgi:hypothetical protein
MIHARRLALSLIVICGLIGFVAKARDAARFALAASQNSDRSLFDMGEKIGPFVYEGLWRTNKGSWRLRSPKCGQPLNVWLFPTDEVLDVNSIEALHPAKEWRAHYIFEGQAYDALPYFRMTAHRWAALLFDAPAHSPGNVAQFFYLAFFVPKQCDIERKATLVATAEIFARLKGERVPTQPLAE